MAQFICPLCGSKYFLTSRTGQKTVFKVLSQGFFEFIQLAEGISSDADLDKHNIFCGACSWHGSIDELVESHL